MSADYCPQCGAQRIASFRFCRQCGLDFDDPHLASSSVTASSRPTGAFAADQPGSPADRTTVPVEVNVPALFVALGGLMGLIGSFLPWVTATIPFAGSIARSGIEGGDGWVSVVLGAALSIVGGALAAGRSASGVAKSSLTVFALGALLAGFGAFELLNVQSRIEEIDVEYRSLAAVGIGIWMIIVGGGMAAVASLRLRGAFQR
jgi:hypothetical protein